MQTITKSGFTLEINFVSGNGPEKFYHFRNQDIPPIPGDKITCENDDSVVSGIVKMRRLSYLPDGLALVQVWVQSDNGEGK